MFPFRTVELAFQRFQTRREPRALAWVFDRTAPELLALARHLAPAGTEAEDLVQATFVTAIEAAGSHRSGERVLPWLCGILGNHARSARRKARRVVDPTRLPLPVGDATSDAEACELRAELQAAIDRLPEVYRPVLRLVFEHGLQAQEVARALERPAGTVRAQVTRGLELLRRTLPAGLAGSVAVSVATGRGLAAVRQSVLAQAGGTGLGAVSPLFVGGLFVLQHKLAAALAAVLVTALGLFLFRTEPPTPVAEASGLDTAPPVASAPIDRSLNAPTTDRSRVAEAPAAAADPAATTPVPVDAYGTVVVHLRGRNGAPLAGVRVALFPFAQLQDFARRMDYVATDANGDARFTGLANESWMIDVDRIGGSGVIQSPPGTTAERTITLSTGVRVAGRVVDRRGAPVEGAQIVLHGSRAAAVEVATTDALGRFAIDHLAQGLEVQARRAGRVPSLAHRVQGNAGTTELELVLGDAARTVRGIVRGPGGQPIGDATVAVLPAPTGATMPEDPSVPHARAHWLRTGADGAFVCDDAEIGPLVVLARALPLAPAWVPCDTTHGDAVADVSLQPGGAVQGRIVQGGAPLAGVNVLAWGVDEVPIGYLQNLFGMRHTTSAADGTFRLEGLVPGPQQLRLMQEMNTLRQETWPLGEGETRNWNVDLDADSSLRITVQADTELPARLVALVHRQPQRDGDVPAVVPIQNDGRGEVKGNRDRDVDVILCTMPGGMSLVQIAAVRGVPSTQAEVTFALRADQLPVRSIHGRLVDAQRAPIAGVVVTAARNDGELIARLDATTGDDGSFTLGPLPAGSYVLLTGPMQQPHVVGDTVLTTDRDERLGDVIDRGGR